jgi:dTDP-4-dehydrorhamnose reductase
MPAAGYAVRPGDSHALADAIAKTLARAWEPGVLSRSVHELTWENTARRICARMSAELQRRTSDRPGN